MHRRLHGVYSFFVLFLLVIKYLLTVTYAQRKTQLNKVITPYIDLHYQGRCAITVDLCFSSCRGLSDCFPTVCLLRALCLQILTVLVKVVDTTLQEGRGCRLRGIGYGETSAF